MSHPAEHQQLVPNPLITDQAKEQFFQQYNNGYPGQRSGDAASYVTVIDDVDMEELGTPYIFRLPRRFAEQAESEEDKERAGRTWRLSNAQALDWQELHKLDAGPAGMFRELLGEDQYREFAKIRGVSGAHVNKIMAAYREHFSLDGGK